MTDTENKTIELTDEELDTVVGGQQILQAPKDAPVGMADMKQAKTPVKTKDKNGVIIVI